MKVVQSFRGRVLGEAGPDIAWDSLAQDSGSQTELPGALPTPALCGLCR